LVFADMALMGTGLGFVMLSLLLAVQHSVLRTELGVATSTSLFARSIGGAVGVAIMGAILAAGLGESVHLTPATLEGAGLAGLNSEMRQQLIVSLQRAFVAGTLASGVAVVASFWLPNFDRGVRPSAVELTLASEMAAVEPETEPVGVND
jgi:hypothetical protein